MSTRWFSGLFKRKDSTVQKESESRNRNSERYPAGHRFYQVESLPGSASFLPSKDPLSVRLSELWASLKENLYGGTQSRQASKLLKQYVQSYNPKYATWHSEFEPGGLTRASTTMARRRSAIPLLDPAVARALLTRLSQFVTDFSTMSSTRHSSVQGLSSGLDIVYLINVLTRHPLNVDLLTADDLMAEAIIRLLHSCDECLTTIVDTKERSTGKDATFADHRAAHTSEEGREQEGQECVEGSERDVSSPDTFLQVMFGNCLQILCHLMCQPGTWKQYVTADAELRAAMVRDDELYYSRFKEKAARDGAVSVIKRKIAVLGESKNDLHGSRYDLLMLLLDSLGSLTFLSAPVKDALREEGLLELLVDWIRWPERIPVASSLQKAPSRAKGTQYPTEGALNIRNYPPPVRSREAQATPPGKKPLIGGGEEKLEKEGEEEVGGTLSSYKREAPAETEQPIADWYSEGTKAAYRGEFELQLKALYIIAHALDGNASNAQRISALGGWEKIMDLLLWLAEVFSIAPVEVSPSSAAPSGSSFCVSSPSGRNTSSSISLAREKDKPENRLGRSSSLVDARGRSNTFVAPAKFPTPEVQKVIDVLFAICVGPSDPSRAQGLVEKMLAHKGDTSGIARTYFQGARKDSVDLSTHPRISDRQRGTTAGVGDVSGQEKMVRIVVRLLIDLFNVEVRHTTHNTRVREKLRIFSGELQLVVLEFLSRIMLASPSSLALCRRYRIWDVLFNDFFFFTPTISVASFPTPREKSDPSNYLRLRQAILLFVTAMASIENHDNVDECQKLLDILEKHSAEMDVVYPIARCLNSILDNNKVPTQENLVRIRALPTLAHIIERQAELFGGTQWEGSDVTESAEELSPLGDLCARSFTMLAEESEGERLSPTPNQKLDAKLIVQGRSAVVKLLGDCLLDSVRLTKLALHESCVVDSLIPLLFETPMRLSAVNLLVYLMHTPLQAKPGNTWTTAAEDDTEAYVDVIRLYNQYFSLLQRAQSGETESDFQLLLCLLHGIRKVVEMNQKTQKRFKEVGAFLHFINLLNVEKDGERLPILCAHVLKTLRFLLAGNKKNKRHLKLLGYDGLKRLVLRGLQVDEKRYLKERLITLLFNLLIDGDFDLEQRYAFQSPDIIPLMFGLCEHVDDEMKLAMFDNFIPLVDKCTLNKELCCQQNLVFILLEMVPQLTSLPLAAKVINIIEILGAHSMTVRELKLLFQVLQSDVNGFRAHYQLLLLTALQYMCKSLPNAPEVFFNFDGVSAGLLLPRIEHFPQQHGLTFCTWLRVESFENPLNRPRFQPRLLSLSSPSSGHHFEIYFNREIVGESSASGARFIHYLVVEVRAHDKLSKHMFSEFGFDEKTWYSVAIVFVNNSRVPWKDSELRLFVNGKVKVKASLKYPTFTDPVEVGRIGINAVEASGPKGAAASQMIPARRTSSTERRTLSPFFGQLGTVYLFDEVLTASHIKGMYDLGPDYASCFQAVDLAMSTIPKSAMPLFEGSLSSHITFCYNCKASEGKYYLEASSERIGGDQKSVQGSMNAKGLGNLYSCITSDVKSRIRCLGGIKVFLPLFAQVDQPLTPLQEGDLVRYDSDPQYLNQVLSCLLEMLYQSDTNQHEFWRCNGFAIIGFLVRSIAFRHVNIETIDILCRFIPILRRPKFLEELYSNLFLDFRVWVYMDFKTQLYALNVLQKWVSRRVKQPTNTVFDTFGVQQVLDILRIYYWYQPTQQTSLGVELAGTEPRYHPVSKEKIGDRPTLPEISQLRKVLFAILHVLVKKEFMWQDTMAFVTCIADCSDHGQMEELLDFINRHLFKGTPGLHEHLIVIGGPDIFLSTLRNESEAVRVHTVRIIAKLLLFSRERAAQQEKSSAPIFPVGGTKVRKPDDAEIYVTMCSVLMTFPFRERMQQLLCMILVNQLKNEQSSVDGMQLSEDVRIRVPEVLPLLFKLLQVGDVLIRQHTLQEIYLLLSSNNANRAVFSKCFGWQNWLFSLLADPESKAQGSSPTSAVHVVSDMIMNILKVMILHEFQEQKAGWKIIERTLAFLHPYALRAVIDPVDVTRRLLVEVVRGIKAECRAMSFSSGNVDPYHFLILRGHSSREEGKLSFLIPNFLRFLCLVEQFVFYVAMVPSHSANPAASSSSNNNTQESPFKVIQGTKHTKTGEWEDLPLILDLLDTLHHMNLLGNSAILHSVADKIKLPVTTINRIALRFALYACSEGDINTCVQNVPRIRQILEVFLPGRNETVNPFLPYVLYHMLKTLRAHWMKQEREKMMNEYEGTEKEKGTDKIPKENISKAVVPLIKDLMFACIASFGKRNNEFVEEFKKLSGQTRIQQFMETFVENFDDPRWESMHDYLETATSQVRQEENAVCAVIERDRARWLSKVETAMDEESDADFMMERKRLQESKTLKDKLIAKERKHRQKKEQERSEQDRRIAWQWRKLLRGLTDERAAWGKTSNLEDRDHWKLDKTENFSRMRLKLRRNWRFDPHSGAAHEIARGTEQPADSPGGESSSAEDKEAISFVPQIQGVKLSDILSGFTEDDSGGAGQAMKKEEEETNKRSKGFLLNANVEEKRVYSTSCELITPMKATPGRLEITTTHLYFWETLEMRQNSGDDLNRAPKDKKWPLDQIREIHMRRYLLRRSALEIFLVNQTNAFLNFEQKERSKVFQKITGLRPPNLVYCESGSPEEILKRSGLTKKWQQRQMSNFDYLMQLNTIAGRTYNDLSQYPVFPWILSNYTTEEIDLTDPKNYRDLTKPIGALNETRLEQFLARYQCFSDPDIPAFHYGSHYSNSAIVLYYLIRVEPFTTLFLKLQGGKFDIADRMFDSIPSTWNNCLTNQADVKELIPEFFYFPEFMLNSNSFYLGKKRGGEGEPINDVVLPAWASSPEEFIRIQREALESEYVSTHLHEWIDLIFGFKQRGKEAVEAVNVFYFLTYEGAVNLDAIKDENMRTATEAQIDHFGQTPSQLMKRPHPPCDMSQSDRNQHLFSDAHRSSLKVRFLEVSKHSLVYIGVPEAHIPSYLSVHLGITERIVTVDRHRTPAAHRWLPAPPDSHPAFVLELDPLLSQRRKIGISFAASLNVSSSLFAVSDDGKMIVSGGHWDNSFKTSMLDNGRQIQSVSLHKDIVTCLALGADGTTLITGSKDTTLAIWQLQMRGNSYRINDQPLHILHGHNDEVTCVCLNVELDVAVSGSKDGSCIVHTVRKGIYVRSIYHPANHAVHLVDVGNAGIVTYSQIDLTIRLFGLNGTPLACVDTKERLNKVLLSKTADYLITGGHHGQDGTVEVRKLHNLKSVYRLPTDSPVCTVALTAEERQLLVGLDDGKMLLISSTLSPSKPVL